MGKPITAVVYEYAWVSKIIRQNYALLSAMRVAAGLRPWETWARPGMTGGPELLPGPVVRLWAGWACWMGGQAAGANEGRG